MQHIDKNEKTHVGIDKHLITMFLKKTPEERLLSNDKTICTIMELRNAFKRRKTRSDRSKCSS